LTYSARITELILQIHLLRGLDYSLTLALQLLLFTLLCTVATIDNQLTYSARISELILQWVSNTLIARARLFTDFGSATLIVHSTTLIARARLFTDFGSAPLIVHSALLCCNN